MRLNSMHSTFYPTVMKNLILISFILLGTSLFAQDKGEEILNIVADKVCECTEKNVNENPDLISECISNGLASQSDKMKEYVAERKEKEGDTFDMEAYRSQTFYDVQKKLIWNCDAYFHFVDFMRTFPLEQYASELPDNYLDSLDTKMKENPDANLYADRASYYFVVENMKSAKSDCKQCLKMDPANKGCLFLMAWIHEKNGDFDEAIEAYENMKNFDKSEGASQIIDIYVEAALRKKDESFR